MIYRLISRHVVGECGCEHKVGIVNTDKIFAGFFAAGEIFRMSGVPGGVMEIGQNFSPGIQTVASAAGIVFMIGGVADLCAAGDTDKLRCGTVHTGDPEQRGSTAERLDGRITSAYRALCGRADVCTHLPRIGRERDTVSRAGII